MSKVFSDYGSVEDVSSNLVTKTDSKKYKKLKKQLKKQEKRIRRLETHQVVEMNNFVTEDKADQKSRERNILTKIGDVLMKSLPNILRTATKIVVTTICEHVFKHSKKPRFA